MSRSIFATATTLSKRLTTPLNCTAGGAALFFIAIFSPGIDLHGLRVFKLPGSKNQVFYDRIYGNLHFNINRRP
jgi:uncharacterized membrane protein